jgi:hypothetical protein
MIFDLRRCGAAVAAILATGIFFALGPTRPAVASATVTATVNLAEQGQAVGDPTDVCLAVPTCYWNYSGVATGSPFPAPVRVVGFIDGGFLYDSIEACFPNATGVFRFFDEVSGRLLLEKRVSGQYCVTRPLGSHYQHTFTGTYTITDVFGPLLASGTGTMTLHDNLALHTFDATEQGTLVLGKRGGG